MVNSEHTVKYSSRIVPSCGVGVGLGPRDPSHRLVKFLFALPLGPDNKFGAEHAG